MPINSSKKQLSRNVIATVTQVLISGVVFFVLYRYLYDRLGIEQIGVWSLVLAATSISRIGELGLSAGVVRFVAQALGRGDTQRAADVVQTIALSLGVFMAALLLLGYPLFGLALRYFLPEHGVPIALSILPYALMSLWVMVVVSVFSGGVDGCMRMDLRSLLMGLSHLVYLGLAMLLVPKYGLEGVAIAQLLQSVGLMVLLWWMLRRQLSELPLIPLNWKYPVLKDMFGYGVNFQMISIMNMLFDPVMKALMSRFGGLEALGYYEMANKLILQGRALIVEGSRVMVPAIARLQVHDTEKATQLFLKAYGMTFYVAVLFYGLLGIFVTTICMLWLGHYQATFVQFALLLNLGWFANTLIGPAFFANLGSGNLRPNMFSHMIMGVTSPVVGAALGVVIGGEGVVLGVVSGLMAGGLYLLVAHFSQAGLAWSRYILPEKMFRVVLLALVGSWVANYGVEKITLTSAMEMSVLCALVLLMVGWFNPARMIVLPGRGQ